MRMHLGPHASLWPRTTNQTEMPDVLPGGVSIIICITEKQLRTFFPLVFAKKKEFGTTRCFELGLPVSMAIL